MNNIGLLIKMSRIQQNMKQVTLAKGICSTSYLSKIENNQTVPSDDIINMLLGRLNLSFNDLSTKDEESLIFDIFNLYKDSIIERIRDQIPNRLEAISKQNILFKESKNFYLYNLYLCRIRLISDPTNAINTNVLKSLEQMKENFDDRQLFIFYFINGLHYYHNKDFKNALASLENALLITSKFHIENWELADFYNVLSITFLENNQLLSAIEFANKSLSIYKDMFIFSRAIDCYIIIGIAYKRNINYKNAEESFLLAKKIANDLNLKEYDSILNHNLGSLSSVRGFSDKAIEYYNKSLQSSIIIENRLTTLFSLIQEYSKLNNYDEIKFWCLKGLSLINQENDPRLLSFEYHFNLYLCLSSNLINKEEVLLKTLIYFESIEDYRHVQKYSILIAEYFVKLRKYKNSAFYFQKANENLYKLKSLKTWEDL